MIAIIVAFILGVVGLFLGLMALGVLLHAWPLLLVVSLWLLYREHNIKRRCRQEEVARWSKVWYTRE